jgi:hypothetical protein
MQQKRVGAAAAAAMVGCMLLLTAAGARSEDSPDQRLTDALLQEGLLLEAQIAKLRPVAAELDRERKRLQGEETQLTDEAAQVTKGFDALNAAADKLNAATQQQREECAAGSSKFQSEADACNGSAAALRRERDTLHAQGTELDKRQEEVNKRIVQHNAAGREWNQRSTAHQQLWMPSIKQVQGWLGRFQDFFKSATFPEFVGSAGNPADCAEERVGALSPFDTLPSLGRALQCLKALKAGAG